MSAPDTGFRLSPAFVSDLPAVRRCARRAYGIYVERIGREPAPMVADFGALQARGALVGCKIGGTLVGFIAAYVKDDHLFIENVAVDPDFQARGIGGQLIAFAETEARFRGLDKVELYTNAGMKENLALYSHLGYEVFDRRVEDGFDRVYFRKNL